jgi:tRNA G37 N-methylase Trm5
MNHNHHKNSIPKLSLALVILAIISLKPDVSSAMVHRTSLKQWRSKITESHRQHSRRKKKTLRKPDVIYYPTPTDTVDEMLRMARIKKGDVLYDLGSGDGRIPIAAAKQYGIRAVGIEIDPKLVTEAQENARQAGVSDLVSFRNEDMFRANVSEATVVALYLSDKLNVLLRPKLLSELRPGSRILSHDFRMGDWPPEQTVRVPWGKLYRTIYLWTVPAHRRRIRNSRIANVQ